jgi:hypothetical protein
LRTTYDKHLLIGWEHCYSLLQRVRHKATLKLGIAASDDNICALRQRSAYRVEGLASHNYGVARSGGTEATHILLDIPKQGVLIAYDAILGNGYND